MCSHRAIVSLLPPPASNQCGVGAVCVPIELLSAYFLLLPPPSVELVQCVSPYMALRVEVCGIWLCEWKCVEYGSESGGVWNMALRVEVCGIWL